LWPPTAAAHLDTTTLGPVYDGAWHLLSHPEILLPVLALALIGGQGGPAAGRRALLTLPLAWLAGGLSARLAAGFDLDLDLGPAAAVRPEVLAALGMLALGLLVAARPGLRPLAVGVLALILGVALGWSGDLAVRGAAGRTAVLIGMAAASFLLVAPVAALTVSLRSGWPVVAVRVAGSWIAAAGLLMFGWAVRG
jgi:hypothetical protein